MKFKLALNESQFVVWPYTDGHVFLAYKPLEESARFYALELSTKEADRIESDYLSLSKKHLNTALFQYKVAKLVMSRGFYRDAEPQQWPQFVKVMRDIYNTNSEK